MRLSEGKSNPLLPQLRTGISSRFSRPENLEQDLDALTATLNQMKMATGSSP